MRAEASTPATEDILRAIRALEPELHALGVRHASVFGSAARGDLHASSDVDLALDFEPGKLPAGFEFVSYIEDLKRRLVATLHRNVDIVVLPARRRELQEALHLEAIRAF